MSIGADLLAARQAAGLSIDDVAAATRVRVTLIRHIEADNFDACGGATYARGHIRNIAAAVGLDPEPLVAEFNESVRTTSTAIPAHQMLDHTEIVQGARTSPNWTAAMLVTAVLLVAVALYSLFTGPGTTPPPTAIVPASSAPVVVPQAEPSEKPNADPTADPSADPSAEPDPQSAPSATTSTPVKTPTTAASSQAASASGTPAPVVAFNGVNVRVTISGARCWVRATDLSIGKKVLFQGVLEPGAVRDLRAASKMSVTFGDAGTATLVVNGRNIGSPGARGDVVTQVFGPGDPGAG